jgi:type IV secretory pathway TraG/TraD family ATPase VirD4
MRAVYASYLGATLRKLMLDLDTIGERNKGPLPVPVGVILDEFPTLGKLDSLVADVNLVRKRRISIMIGAQTKGQFHMIYGNEGTQALFTGLATQVIYGGCDADTAEFYSKASGTATTDANADDPNSHGRLSQGAARQRPLLTVDEVVTPQVGNCTIFARYVEAGFATQVVLNARLTRFYERDDWKQRLNAARDVQPLLLERGIALNLQPVETSVAPVPKANIPESATATPSTLEIAALMARVAAETQKQTNGKVQATSMNEMRNRHEKRKRAVKEVTQ